MIDYDKVFVTIITITVIFAHLPILYLVCKSSGRPVAWSLGAGLSGGRRPAASGPCRSSHRGPQTHCHGATDPPSASGLRSRRPLWEAGSGQSAPWTSLLCRSAHPSMYNGHGIYLTFILTNVTDSLEANIVKTTSHKDKREKIF